MKTETTPHWTKCPGHQWRSGCGPTYCGICQISFQDIIKCKHNQKAGNELLAGLAILIVPISLCLWWLS